MTSNRRTQSTICLDRSYINGENLNCSPPKITSPSASNWTFRLRRVLSGVFHQKSSKKGNPAWKRYLMPCFFFFILGLLLGLIPAADIEDMRNYDTPFKIRSPPFHSQKDFVDGHQKENYAIENLKTERIVSLKSDERENQLQIVPRKLLIIVTPTYNRPIQAYYLHRLSQELRLVPPPLLWIVVEMNAASLETASILSKTGVMYRHLVCFKNSTNIKDRGVHQRNTALEHIGRHKLDGIVYFADDDNAYSLELFEHLREIRRFGTWPVGMLAQSKSKATLEGPVCNGSQVIGWHTNERSKRLRRFHVDMSGFAFNSTILWDAKRWNRPTSYSVRQLDTVKEGFQETTFIEQIVEDESQMEGLPHDCSKIMNWHLHLEAHFYYPKEWRLQKYLDAVITFK